MKKSLKFGIATLAILATVSATLLNSDTNAQTNVKLTITAMGGGTGGANTCTLGDYTFSAEASASNQTLSVINNTMSCTLGKVVGGNITIQSSNLASGSISIPSSNVKLTTNLSNRTSNPTGLGVGKTVNNTALGTAQIIYSKNANVIGLTTGTNIGISVTVPGGTPQGTYNGTLTVTLPN